MSDVAIRVDKLSKRYKIGVAKNHHDTLRDHVMYGLKSLWGRNGDQPSSDLNGNGSDTIWALKDISFEVRQGEVIGIIGRNGAGKSTLLKILSRITEPTTGYADIRGRMSSLLEVGTGFHGELTGRENIYLNGAILGMRKAEIDRKFDEIVAFSEVEKFIHTPVKHYSSGMYVRLAFAVAAHLEPEILIVDEVLAVGDAAFQKKCLGKMGDVAKQGRTILFVSHNMQAIVQLCERTVHLEDGQIKSDGVSASVVSAYLTPSEVGGSIWQNPSPDRPDNVQLQFKFVRILSMDSQPTAVIEFDKEFQIEIGYQVLCRIKGLSVTCQVLDSQGSVVWGSWDTDPQGWKNNESVREPRSYLSTCKVPPGLLKPGRYILSVGSCSSEGLLPCHENVLSFDISQVGYQFNPNRQGIITPLLKWSVTGLDRDN